MQNFLVVFSCLALFPISSSAQWFIGVKLMGVSIHTDEHTNGHLYKSTIGKSKRVALHVGIAVTTEYMFNDWFSMKVDQVAFRDCAGKFAGMTMFNLRYTQQFGRMGNGSVGMGPFFYYRKNWIPIVGYVDDGYFKESANKKWQTKFVWYGGELEHNYPLNNKLDISTNILPGIPVVVAVASGVRMRIE